ncbi:MAG TPA: PAS domain S-box protein [Methanosarcina sp.]
MKEKLRNSGINIIGDVPWGTHFCQFYQTKKDLMDILIPYFKAGLENNEFCLWVTPELLEVEEAKEALRRVVPDIDVYMEKKQIEIIPYTYCYIKTEFFDSESVLNGLVEKLDQALAHGYDGLRIAGNIPCLKKGNWDSFVDYEKKMDVNIGKRQIISLCPYFLDVCSTADSIDIAFNHQFSLIRRKGKWERIENSERQNITECNRIEEGLLQSKQRVRLKFDNFLSPTQEMANLELADIIDIQVIQSLMDDFYKLVHIPIGLNDLKGNVLVGAGWQDICTKFHRVHPETFKHCVESNIKLSSGVSPGEFKLYRCKNNMLDIVTPIMVGDQHVGYVFAGQFFFEDEPLDYELFRAQARQYGFNEEEYIAALKKVPRLSREAVDTSMAFFMTFANMISQLSYSNIKLSQSLAERDTLVDALRESEDRFRSVLENSLDVAYRRNLQTDIYDYMSPVVEKITGFSAQEISVMSANETLGRVHPDDLLIVTSGLVQAYNDGFGTLEYRFKHKDGKYRWFADSFTVNKDQNGRPLFSGGIVRDITERKNAEEALKKVHENLEEKVKERTTELEKAYNSLKENEKGLAEAQKIAHIGNWDWDLVTGEIYWSEELYRIFGRSPQESGATYDELLNYIHPEDREYVNNAIKTALNGRKALSGKLFGIDYRIVLASGEERTVHSQPEIIFDENNIPIRVKGIVQDITECNRAEEKLQILANAVESSNDAIVTESLEGIITSWNKGAEQVYGYSAEEILGKNVSILASANLKDETKRLINRIKQGIKIKNYETSRLRKDGKLITVSITLSPIFDASGKLVAISAIARDITERVKAEETMAKIEDARKKEIHHRIKNNLQVISSLLDLQAEKFRDKEVLEAFRESQSRVLSMSLIHEELYKGKGADTLDFSIYLQNLAENLFQTYSLSSKNIHLNTDLEENTFFDMDVAVPLGIIVNELVSNSLKHAFTEGEEGEIRVKLCREEINDEMSKFRFSLTVSDNGKGIPENLELENLESLGLQLVSTLVDQLNGKIELKRDLGTEFKILFDVVERL